MSILSADKTQKSNNSVKKLLSADPQLEETPEAKHYEESLSIMCIPWTVNAVFCGGDPVDVEERRLRARRIINRFDNDIDAHITGKRSELAAELCLICDELEID